jgi:hypothetical protein
MSGASPPPGAEKRTGKPDFEPLKLAIIAACGEGSLDDARKVWRMIQNEAGGKTPVPDIAAACEMVADVGVTWRQLKGSKPLVPGLVATRARGRVHPWQQAQTSRKHQEQKAAAFARDKRINDLARYLREIARADLPADERGYYEEWIAAADADELAIARSLPRTQAAG